MSNQKRYANTIRTTPEKNSGISKTKPNMVMQIAEIHQRFVRGQTVEQRQAIYQEAEDFAFGLDRFEAIDKAIAEATELRARFRLMLENSDKIKAEKEALKKMEKRQAKRQAVEDALIDKKAKELGVE